MLKKIVKIIRESRINEIFSGFSETVGISLIIFVVILAIFSPQLAPYSPTKTDVLNKFSAPSFGHLLGTDHLGRDLLSRLIFGTRLALIIALFSIAFAVVTSLFLGFLAGYFSGITDNILVWFFDVLRSFPAVLLAITILTLVGGATLPIFIAVLGITRIPSYGRLFRAQVQKVREEDYVMAADAIGSSVPHTGLRHILPNAIGPLFIQAAMDIPVIITYEAGVSFLGLGLSPPTADWGRILRTGYNYLLISPWMIIFSSLFLILATLGFTFAGEALRDWLDPSLKRETGGV